jgi:tetratricopeptide (TPR) repeat protein
MFFKIATSFVAVLFIGLVAVGFRHRSWIFVVMNLAGTALNALAVWLDVGGHLNMALLLVATPILALILAADITLVFREPRKAAMPTSAAHGKSAVVDHTIQPLSLLVTDEKRFLRELDHQSRLSAKQRDRALKIWRQSNDAYQQRDYDLAKTQYGLLGKLAATPSVLNDLAVVELASNHTETALQHCEKACSLDPEHHEAWHNRGVALLISQRSQEAMACFDQVIVLQPNVLEPWICRGNVFVQSNRFELALESYDAALGLNPKRPECWNNRGVALNKMGRRREALANFEQALKIMPDYFPATLNRVLVSDRLRRFDLAKNGYRRFLQQPPPQLNGRLVLIRSRLRQLENDSVGQPAEIDLSALEPELAL